jgi:hypothetical protein
MKDNENDTGVQTTLNEPMCLTIVLFGVLLRKKHVFIERNYRTKYKLFIYFIYSCPNMSCVFLESI